MKQSRAIRVLDGVRVPVLDGETAVPMRVPSHGHGSLQVGRPLGHPGSGGAPPEEYRAWCRDAVRDPVIRERIMQALRTDDVFPVRLWEVLMERGFGKVPQAQVQDAEIRITVRHDP